MTQLQLGEAIPATAFFDVEGNLVGRVLGELNKSDLQHRIAGASTVVKNPALVDGFHKKTEPSYGPPVLSR